MIYIYIYHRSHSCMCTWSPRQLRITWKAPIFCTFLQCMIYWSKQCDMGAVSRMQQLSPPCRRNLRMPVPWSLLWSWRTMLQSHPMLRPNPGHQHLRPVEARWLQQGRPKQLPKALPLQTSSRIAFIWSKCMRKNKIIMHYNRSLYIKIYAYAYIHILRLHTRLLTGMG